MAQIIQIQPRKYQNSDSAKKVIEYMARLGEHSNRAADLKIWGTSAGHHYCKTPEQMIAEFDYIQHDIYHQRGSLMVHYSFRITLAEFEKMNCDWYKFADFATMCCRYIFDHGFQSCFAIHLQFHSDGSPDIHFHLAINTVGYNDSHKLCQYPNSLYNTIQKPLLDMFYTYINTCSFSDLNMLM